jgi:hypothetical protein
MSDEFLETLLDPSLVRLFGRPFGGLTLSHAEPAAKSGKSALKPSPLGECLKAENDPRLARIYGFSYEGSYYKLSKPYVFVVHGDGTKVGEVEDMSALGVEFRRDEKFFDDVVMWAYDKVDMSVRIDIVSGPLDEILLDPALTSATNMTSGDLNPRIDMQARADLQSRIDMQVRADTQMRGRFSR